MQIWDTCGQEVYLSLINGFYRSSSLAILAYFIDNNKNFNSLESWLNKIRTKGNPNVKLFLIGNKIDLKEKRKVTEEQANKFHIDYGFYLFYFWKLLLKLALISKKFLLATRTLYEQNLNFKEIISNASRDSNQAIIGFTSRGSSTIIVEEEDDKKTKKRCL